MKEALLHNNENGNGPEKVKQQVTIAICYSREGGNLICQYGLWAPAFAEGMIM